jgi:hypothetical protein
LSDDGRLFTLGALGVLLAGAAAIRGSRTIGATKPWIHYDAVAKGEIAKLADMANEMIERGMKKREVDQLLKDALSKGDERERRGMGFVQAFLDAGQQVFVVGPKLEQMFVNTGLDRVPREVLKAPYKAFWLALPGSELRLWSQRNGWCVLRGMYVDGSDPDQLRLLLYGPIPTREEPNATNEAYLYLDFDKVYGASGGDLEGYLVDKFGEALRLRSLTLPADVMAELMSVQIQALRIAVNAMLYINANGAELTPDPSYLTELALHKRLMAEKRKVENGHERERAKRREIARIDEKAAKVSGATVVWLGRSIEEAESAKASSAERRRRHWVRGHWRVPARKHGERQLVWVQPYERYADEEATVTRHTYKTKDSDHE